MTSIVASTGVGSPRRCLHPRFDRARARGCKGGRDDQASGRLIDFERAQANARRVDLKQREPVPARKGGTSAHPRPASTPASGPRSADARRTGQVCQSSERDAPKHTMSYPSQYTYTGYCAHRTDGGEWLAREPSRREMAVNRRSTLRNPCRGRPTRRGAHARSCDSMTEYRLG